MRIELNVNHLEEARRVVSLLHEDSNNYGRLMVEVEYFSTIFHRQCYPSTIQQPELISQYELYKAMMNVWNLGMIVENLTPTYPCGGLTDNSHINALDRNGVDDIVVIPLRDIPHDEAKQEIIAYINDLQKSDLSDLCIGEIARKLRLDMEIVIEVFEERGLL